MPLMLASGPAAMLAHSLRVAVQVVCGSCVLWDVQRGLTATATTAGLHPQQLLQEGNSYCDLS